MKIIISIVLLLTLNLSIAYANNNKRPFEYNFENQFTLPALIRFTEQNQGIQEIVQHSENIVKITLKPGESLSGQHLLTDNKKYTITVKFIEHDGKPIVCNKNDKDHSVFYSTSSKANNPTDTTAKNYPLNTLYLTLGSRIDGTLRCKYKAEYSQNPKPSLLELLTGKI